MKIVVTGALGHIGSRLIRELPTMLSCEPIILIDNLATQRFPSLFNLPEAHVYKFVEADVIKSDLKLHFANSDAVIHLAALTDAAGSFDHREEVERVNYNATKSVAEACIITGTPLIHLSSTSVYGTQKEVVDEECGQDDLKPQSPYAEIKLREERLLKELAHVSGLRHITCRFGTIFGTSPGIRFHTAVNKFCWQAVMGQPLTVWKTAMDQKRPYLDLGDATNAIAHILKNKIYDGRIYNVLTLNATVRDIISTIKKFVPDLEVDLVDAKIMNQLSYEVLMERFLKTGFVPSGSLAESIQKTIELLNAFNSNVCMK